MRAHSITWLKKKLDEQIEKESSYQTADIVREEIAQLLEEREKLENIQLAYIRSLSVRLGLFLTKIPRILCSWIMGQKF